MRLSALLSLACLVVSPYAMAQEATQILTPPGGKKVTDVASYGIGYDVGMNIASNGLKAADVSREDLLAGLLDALTGNEPAVQPELVQKAMQALGEKIRDRKKQESVQYLEANKKKDGVVALPSGLQYKVLKSGSGRAPTADSTVSVHYEGKLINGEIFDSSIQRGEPTSFPVGQVIPGWTEALLRMKVGDKWQLFIPPDLAYGERGSPPVIGPNETLTFEVELLEVQ